MNHPSRVPAARYAAAGGAPPIDREKNRFGAVDSISAGQTYRDGKQPAPSPIDNRQSPKEDGIGRGPQIAGMHGEIVNRKSQIVNSSGHLLNPLWVERFQEMAGGGVVELRVGRFDAQ